MEGPGRTSFALRVFTRKLLKCMGRRERRCKAIKPEGREGHIHIAPSFWGSKKVREAIFGAKQEKEKMEAEGCV